MNDRLDVSLIIPAYNEEKKIEKDIREAVNFFDKTGLNAEIIISTDGITDRTNEIVKNLQKDFKKLILLSETKKIGKGAAIKKGVKIAQGRYIMFVDAGLCVPFAFVKDGMNKIGEGYDCALASREAKGSLIIKQQPVYRKIGSKIFGVIARNIIGIPKNIQDTQCGFKIYKKKVAKELFSQLKTDGFMFDIELILRSKKANYSMTSFPIQWSNDSDTKFDPITGSMRNFKDLYKIKFLYKL